MDGFEDMVGRSECFSKSQPSRLAARCFSDDETNMKIGVDSGRSKISRGQWKWKVGQFLA